MAYQNFIPTVWAEAINRELEKALVYAEGCNRPVSYTHLDVYKRQI